MDFIQNLDEAIAELSQIENPSEDILTSLEEIRRIKAAALAASQNPQFIGGKGSAYPKMPPRKDHGA